MDLDGLIRGIGGGIVGLVAGAFGLIGATLTSMYTTLVGLVPGGLVGVAVGGGLLLLLSWNILRR
jgi:hypothetical protein